MKMSTLLLFESELGFEDEDQRDLYGDGGVTWRKASGVENTAKG